jgi:hypothetical protein
MSSVYALVMLLGAFPLFLSRLLRLPLVETSTALAYLTNEFGVVMFDGGCIFEIVEIILLFLIIYKYRLM